MSRLDELLPRLPPSRFPDGLLHAAGRWVTNGAWCARGEVVGAFDRSDLGAKINELLALPRTPVVEDAGFRFPFVPGIPRVARPCSDCGGSGECECPCCQAHHDCGKCDGHGEFVTDEGVGDDDGQRVFVGGGSETVVADRMGLLLDGLPVVRLGGSDGALGGLDESGEIIAMVMPLRGQRRDRAAADPVMAERAVSQ